MVEEPGPYALPAEPREVLFKAGDGQDLVGRYYPGASNPSPLVVLMHWAPGDQNDWRAIAAWLQNRGLAQEGLGGQPWLDASWFPTLPEGGSFGVFTFTFRNCEGGCKDFVRAAWLIDARAAMETARQLEGVDPDRIVGIGASIGADGAIDGCTWLNASFPNSCQGALSLSPGDYLTVPYRNAVDDLGAAQPPKPAHCLYAEGDVEARRSCEAASGDHYTAVKYSGSDHGMTIIQPASTPNPLQLILDFLTATIGS
jgi:dienelactone hydrolase